MNALIYLSPRDGREDKPVGPRTVRCGTSTGMQVPTGPALFVSAVQHLMQAEKPLSQPPAWVPTCVRLDGAFQSLTQSRSWASLPT